MLVLLPALAVAQWEGDWDSDKYRTQIDALGETASASLPIPVLVGVEVADLTQNFGDPREGGTRTHEGLDIVAPQGTPVASPTDAVVTGTGTGTDSGVYIRTANPGGETFVYMHLSNIATNIEPGSVVKRGEVIGFVGNTGNAVGTGAHLHFEIRQGGAQDPYPRLTQVFTAEERALSLAQALEQGGTVPSVTNFIFTRDLEFDMGGEDIRALQVFLNTHGYAIAAAGAGSRGSETNYFGALTRAALAHYQKANGIAPAVGYFGPKTRAHVSKLASRYTRQTLLH
jgi:hypothetical protein